MPNEGNDKAWPFKTEEYDDFREDYSFRPQRHEPTPGGYQTTAQPEYPIQHKPARHSLSEALQHTPSHGMFARPASFDTPTEVPMGQEPLNVLKAQVEDLVNSPTHYAHGAIECIDAIRQALGKDQFEGFCHGNAIKYLWRANFKGTRERDLQKATWYMRMLTGDDPREAK